MRYSVVLPRIDAADGAAVRQALERARSLWAQGAQGEAIELVRAAAEAAVAAGDAPRGAMLKRAADSLRGVVDSHPPAAKKTSRAPAPRPVTTPVASVAPKKQSVSGAVAGAAGSRRRTPAKGTPATSAPTQAPRRRTPSPGENSVRRPVPASSAQGAITAAPPRSPASPAPPTAAPTPSPSPLPDLAEGELVVTVAPSDWKLASREALVGRRAVRVAIGPAAGPRGALTVMPLAPGEVAPQGMSVALLVALEPDALPLPRTA